MYTITQIIKGLQRPDLARKEFKGYWQQVQTHLPHDIGVQGSYLTGNIGDRAIGEAIMAQLSSRGHRTTLFGKNHEHSTAPVRILGGGGVLHDWYGTVHLQRRLNFLSNTGAVIGVGVPGFKTKAAREIATAGLRDIDLVTVRDDWSRQRLELVFDGEIHTTACPALLHNDPHAETTGKTGVNFRPWFYLDPEVMSYYFDYDENLDHERSNEAYIENVTRICQEISDPIFIPFDKKDEGFARNHLDIEILPYKFSIKRTLKQVSSVDRMIAMRYHSLIFATICDTPTLAIAYEPKVACLAERVGISSYKPHHDIPIKFESISNRYEIRQAAEKNFQFLDEYLEAQL